MTKQREHCEYCKTELRDGAIMCHDCKKFKKVWKNNLQYFGVGVSLIMMLLSIIQLDLACNQRSETESILKSVKQVDSSAQRSLQEVRKLQSIGDYYTKSMGGDRSAFDSLLWFSQSDDSVKGVVNSYIQIINKNFEERGQQGSLYFSYNVDSIGVPEIDDAEGSKYQRDVNTVSYDSLMRLYAKQTINHKIYLSERAAGYNGIKEYDKLRFYAFVLKQSNDLDVVQHAVYAIRSHLKLRMPHYVSELNPTIEEVNKRLSQRKH